MTLTRQEANELYRDFETFAARYGGVVDRETFNVVVELAAQRDPSAVRALAKIYRFCVSELMKKEGQPS